MQKVKIGKKIFVKVISIEILVCVITAAIIGLGLLFNLIHTGELLGNVMLSLLTLFIAGLFLLNSINAVTSGNKVGMFSAIMIIISAAMFLILIWLGGALGSFSNAFSYIIVIVSMVSILLNTIISHYIVLGTKLLIVQVFMYLNLAYVEIVLSFVILGNSVLMDYWQIFATSIIIAITLYIVLTVKKKNIAQKQTEEAILNSDEYVTLKKTDYENMLAELNRLKEAAGVSVSDSKETPAENTEHKKVKRVRVKK